MVLRTVATLMENSKVSKMGMSKECKMGRLKDSEMGLLLEFRLGKKKGNSLKVHEMD